MSRDELCILPWSNDTPRGALSNPFSPLPFLLFYIPFHFFFLLSLSFLFFYSANISTMPFSDTVHRHGVRETFDIALACARLVFISDALGRFSLASSGESRR